MAKNKGRDPHKEALDRRRAQMDEVAATAMGRKASAPLYVMLEPERKERYEAAATVLGMSMREWVTNALDAAVAQQQGAIDLGPATDMENVHLAPEWPHTRLNAHAVRLDQLEQRIRTLEQHRDDEINEKVRVAIESALRLQRTLQR